MPNTIVILVLSSVFLVSCSEFDTTEPVSVPSSLDKVQIKCPDKVKYEDKTYQTVLIGDQCWLRENLDVGARIDGINNQTNNCTIEKYCYDDDPANCATYGGLYQWNEAMQYDRTEGARGICPKGWHIPTLAEYQTLASTVFDANALKAIGQGTGEGAGTNTSGFSGLLGGYRFWDGSIYYDIHGSPYPGGSFWSSTEEVVDVAYGMYLTSEDSEIFLGYGGGHKDLGLSVRCLQD